jgi:hypothetical protein
MPLNQIVEGGSCPWVVRWFFCDFLPMRGVGKYRALETRDWLASRKAFSFLWMDDLVL